MGYDNVNNSELGELAKTLGFREKESTENIDTYRLALSEYVFQQEDTQTALDILGVSKNPEFVVAFKELENYGFLDRVETAALTINESLVNTVREYRRINE